MAKKLEKSLKKYIFPILICIFIVMVSLELMKSGFKPRDQQVNDAIVDQIAAAFKNVNDLEDARYQLTSKDLFLNKYNQTLTNLQDETNTLKTLKDSDHSQSFRLSAIALLEEYKNGLESENYKKIIDITFNDNQLTKEEKSQIDVLRYDLDIKAKKLNQNYLEEQRNFAKASGFKLVDENLSIQEIPTPKQY